MPKTTAEPANQHVAKAQKLIRHVADVHQLGREQEKRHCEQNIAGIETVQDLLGGGPEIETRQQQIEDGAGYHRIADRESKQAKAEDGANAESKWTGHRA